MLATSTRLNSLLIEEEDRRAFQPYNITGELKSWWCKSEGNGLLPL